MQPVHNHAPPRCIDSPQLKSHVQRSSMNLFRGECENKSFIPHAQHFCNYFDHVYKKKKAKRKRKDVFDLIITNKNSLNTAFHESDGISKERWDESTCHIQPIHQIHRRSHRRGHRRTAAGRTLCCYSEMSCHHKCCWVLKQENKWV